MKNTQKKSAQYWEAYKTRVQELEAEGLCTSDAQSVADVEFDESLKNVDEHTPGPWVVDFCNGKPYVVNGNFCAARVHGTEKTLLANARLIAARSLHGGTGCHQIRIPARTWKPNDRARLGLA
jgi:hypothetical protein